MKESGFNWFEIHFFIEKAISGAYNQYFIYSIKLTFFKHLNF